MDTDNLGMWILFAIYICGFAVYVVLARNYYLRVSVVETQFKTYGPGKTASWIDTGKELWPPWPENLKLFLWLYAAITLMVYMDFGNWKWWLVSLVETLLMLVITFLRAGLNSEAENILLLLPADTRKHFKQNWARHLKGEIKS